MTHAETQRSTTGLVGSVLSRRQALEQMVATALLAPGLGLVARTAVGKEGEAVVESRPVNDRRLGPQTDLNGYFPFSPPATLKEWEERAEYVRRQVLVANGLWPLPPRPELNPVVHGLVERDEYTVEKVYFETSPGLYVTGSLYRPKMAGPTLRDGKLPAVLSPHGHSPEGRFHDHGEKVLEKELASGAEKFATGGRHPIQARCVHLARLGVIVFVYDMLGYADRGGPLSMATIHTLYEQRPELSRLSQWSLGSAQAELRMLNPMGLQTWNSIRALDFLLSLPGVDEHRVGVTGESGGGTQTFVLGAVDSRPKALFPVVMVSTGMQGGCTCENASYLRVNTGNVELAALSAPRPLGMVAADDWTVELETKGLPELKQLYGLYGASEKVFGKYLPFPHNYNQPSRELMYEFFNRHLELGYKKIPAERDYVPLTVAESSVWDATHPAPPVTIESELAVIEGLVAGWEAHWDSLKTHYASQSQDFARDIGGAWDVLIGRNLKKPQSVTWVTLAKLPSKSGEPQRTVGRLVNATHGEEVPAVWLRPEQTNGRLVIWLTDRGKAGLFELSQQPIPPIQRLLDAGFQVMGLDVLYQGDFLVGQPASYGVENRLVKNYKGLTGYVGYTYGYNHPVFSQRVHDVLTAIQFAVDEPSIQGDVAIAGFGQSALWGLGATAQAGPVVKRLAVGTDGFRFGSITSISDLQLVPGAVKYGDTPGLVGLCARSGLWISGEPTSTNEWLAMGAAAWQQPMARVLAKHPRYESLAAAEWLCG